MKLDRLQLLTYGLPLLVILSSIGIALSPLIHQYPELATAITFDLTLTAPLLFLLLTTNSGISKLKAVPFFVVGIIIASYLIPESGQQDLVFIKSYLLPLVEIVLFGLLIVKINKGVKTFKSNATSEFDFHEICAKSAKMIFGKSMFTTLFATEVSMFYYAFFTWKKRSSMFPEFTNYKENASIALAGGLIMVILIETFATHLLLLKWNVIAAWIFTGTSIYSVIMIVGHVKALVFRPTLLTEDYLILKNGLLSDIKIPLDQIEQIEYNTAQFAIDDKKIGNLGLSKESNDHNINIHFKTPQSIHKIYGFTESCNILLFQIDKGQDFVQKVKSAQKSFLD